MASHTVRILADSKNKSQSVADAATLESPFWWRGNDLRLELALADNGAFLTAAAIGTITVVVKALTAGADDAPVMLKTIGSGDCDAGFTASEWNAKTGQLCVAEWTRVEAALAAGTYKLIVSHDDPAGNRNTYLSTVITVREDQHDSVSLSAPPAPPAEYYTRPESDGRYLSKLDDSPLSETEKDNLEKQWPENLGRGVEFEDDFERADTAAGTISNAPNGFVYDVRAEGSASGDVRILNGEVQDSNLGGTYYFGGQCIADKVYNMGAQVEWRTPGSPAGAGNNTALILIIKPDDAWLNALIHIIFTRAQVSVQVAESGGTGGFVSLGSVNFPVDDNANSTNNRFLLDESVKCEAVILGDRLIVLMNGAVKIDVTDSRIASVNGNRLYWECFGGSLEDDMFIQRIWANDFREGGHSVSRYQGRSRTLDLLSQGLLDLYSHARMRLGNLFVDRGHIMASKILARSLTAGRTGAFGPVLSLYGQFDDFDAPTENTAGATNQNLVAYTIFANTFTEVGSQLQIRAMGDFANVESKTIDLFLNASKLATTTSLSDGHFEIEVWISRTTTEVFDCWGKVTLSDGTIVMDSWTISGAPENQVLFRVRATAATAGSVRLSKVIGVMHHSRELDL